MLLLTPLLLVVVAQGTNYIMYYPWKPAGSGDEHSKFRFTLAFGASPSLHGDWLGDRGD